MPGTDEFASLPAPCATGGWTRAQLLVAAAGLAILAAAALQIDLPLAKWAAGKPLAGDLRRLVSLAEVFGWGGSVALIILTAATLDPRGWRVAWRLALSAYGAGLLADVCKLLISRSRPMAADLTANAAGTFVEWLPLLHHQTSLRSYLYSQQSFPSAHSATAAGLAVALAALYPRGRWLFATFAVMACLQRVIAQAHFPSDVLAGAAIGCLVGAIVSYAAAFFSISSNSLRC